MLRHRWEVFFITQRPFTEGETVQRQTQRWLVAQGFDLPSVLVLRGSRGAAAAALGLDYHVDDSPQNCVDVIADSTAKTILIVSESNTAAIASARKLGIGVAHRISDALDILDQATLASTNRQPVQADREDGGLEINSRQSTIVSRQSQSSVSVVSLSRVLVQRGQKKGRRRSFASGPSTLSECFELPPYFIIQHSAFRIA